MRTFTALFLLSLFGASVANAGPIRTCTQTETKSCDSLTVSGRTFTFVPARKTEATAQVLSDGKLVHAAETAAYVSWVARARLKGETVVVISLDDGGSGTVPQYALLVIPSNAKADPRVLLLPETAQDAAPRLRSDGTALTVDLGAYDGKRRISTYRKGTLATADKADGGRVPDEDCRWVHDIMKSCAAMKSDGTDCTATSDHLGMAAVRGFYRLASYPRFSKPAASEACIAACETGITPSLKSVRDTVCGR